MTRIGNLTKSEICPMKFAPHRAFNKVTPSAEGDSSPTMWGGIKGGGIYLFISLLVLFAYNASATMSGMTPDATIVLKNTSTINCWSDGNWIFISRANDGLYVIKDIPASGTVYETQSATKLLGGFTSGYPGPVASNGTQLAVVDSSAGYVVVRIWSLMPADSSPASGSSCTILVTSPWGTRGISSVCIRGSKLAFANTDGYSVQMQWYWENMPLSGSAVETNSATGLHTGNYSTPGTWIDGLGRYYTAQIDGYGWHGGFDVFDSPPSGRNPPVTSSGRKAAITRPGTGFWYWPFVGSVREKTIANWSSHLLIWHILPDTSASANNAPVIFQHTLNDAAFCDSNYIYLYNSTNRYIRIYRFDLNYLYVNVAAAPQQILSNGSQNATIARIDLSTDTDNCVIDKIRIDKTGTLADSYVTSVKMYEDSNASDSYEQGVDSQIGTTQVFDSGSATFSGLGLTIQPTGRKILVSIDISTLALMGKNIGIKVDTVSYISLSTTDFIKHDSFPFQTTVFTIGPKPVSDLSAEPGKDSGAVNLKWSCPVEYSTLSHYRVVYSDTLIGNVTQFDGATQLENRQKSGETEEYSVSGLVAGKTYYFSVAIVDVAGNQSGISNCASARAYSPYLVTGSSDSEVVIGSVNNDKTKIVIPPGAVKKQLFIIITKKDVTELTKSQKEEPKSNLSVQRDVFTGIYEFIGVDAETNKEEAGVEFASPVQITLEYSDNGITYREERHLAIFYWDINSFKWVKLGGRVDTDKNTITTVITHFTLFAVMISTVEALEVSAIPNPFTPNGDGINEFTTFAFNEANATKGKADVRIFDINGKIVKVIEQGISEKIYWTGDDAYGRKCESGVYIYQIISDNKLLGVGTIVIAR